MSKKDKKLTKAEIQKIVDEKSKSKEVVEKYEKKRGKQAQEIYSDAEYKEDFWEIYSDAEYKEDFWSFVKDFFRL